MAMKPHSDSFVDKLSAMSLTEAKYELKSKKDEDDPKYTSHEGLKKKKKDKKKKNKDVDVKVKLDGSPPKSKAEMLRGSSKDSPGYPPAKERASQSPSVCDQLPESAKATASSIKTDKARYEPQEDVFMKSERDRSVERPDDRSKRSSLPGDKSELKLPYHRRESQGNGGQSDMSYVEDHDDSMQEYDGHYGGRFHQRQNSEGGFQPGRGFDKKRRNQPWNSDRNQASRGSWSDPRGPDASRGRGRSRGSWSDPRGHDDRRRSFPSPQGRSPANTSCEMERSLVLLSRKLSSILRHRAEEMGLKFQEGGFLYVEELLDLHNLREYTVSDIEEVVEKNDKKRFHMESAEDGRLRIRANQGHSVQIQGLELTPVTDPTQFPVVIHGTYHKHWNAIKEQGLSRRSRAHIHFAPGVPGEDQVISGMRGSCDLLIYIDLEKVLKDGVEFFLSANNVILSPGDGNGFILPKYFSQVIDRKTKQKLL